jgi:hypothetical protein
MGERFNRPTSASTVERSAYGGRFRCPAKNIF